MLALLLGSAEMVNGLLGLVPEFVELGIVRGALMQCLASTQAPAAASGAVAPLMQKRAVCVSAFEKLD